MAKWRIIAPQTALERLPNDVRRGGEIGQSMVAPGLRMITSGLSFSNEQGDAGITGRGTARGMVTVRFGMPERRIFPEDRGPK